MKCILLRTKKYVGKLPHYSYSKRLVSHVDITFAKFFYLYMKNSGLDNQEFIMYDNFHKLFHKSSVIVHQCDFLLDWLLNCNNLDELIDLSIIAAKCSKVIQKWSAKYSLYL